MMSKESPKEKKQWHALEALGDYTFLSFDLLRGGGTFYLEWQKTVVHASSSYPFEARELSSKN